MKKNYETDHYIFTYNEGSLAEKDIILIATEQEKSYMNICQTLKVTYDEKIHYILTESAEEIGKLYNGEPCNGLSLIDKNEIFALYTKDIKCIGPHEDAHIISLNKIAFPDSDFLIEGLAMYFDQKWWGLDNDLWTKYYYEKVKMSILTYLENNELIVTNCFLTYPLAGGFTKYLINTYGIDAYLTLFKSKEKDIRIAFKMIFNESIEEIEKSFWNLINKINLSNKDILLMDKELKDNDIELLKYNNL